MSELTVKIEVLESYVCLVCLHGAEELLPLDSDWGTEYDVSNVLYDHLGLQTIDVTSSFVCNKCWQQVSAFHNFYLQVQLIHASDEDVDCADIVANTKDSTEQISPTLHEVLSEDAASIETDASQEEIEFLVECDESSHSNSSDGSPASKTNAKHSGSSKNSGTPTKPVSTKEERIFRQPVYKIEEDNHKISQYCKLMCEPCDQLFTTFTEMKQHHRVVHSTVGFVICCGRRFTKRSRLLDHVTKHLDPDAFRCEDCGKSFSASQALGVHYSTAHGSPAVQTFKCDKCDRTFAKRFLLTAHMVQHVAENDKKFICQECHKPFANRVLLNVHLKVHGPAKYVCDVCAKRFKAKYQLVRHLSKHSGANETARIQCEVCSKWLKNPISFRKHMIRHTSAGTEHICAICGKQSPNALALQSHIAFVHTKQKVFECTVCKKAFKRSFSLEEHMATHTGKVLYQCPVCAKDFKSSANLYAHKKKKHPKEWEQSKVTAADGQTKK